MKGSLALLFTLALVSLFVIALVSAQGFRAQARLFPIVIAVVGLALAILQLALAARHMRAGPELGASSSAPSPEIEARPTEQTGRRMAAIMGWIAVFTAGVLLLGFPLAVPILTLAYLRLDAHESWPTSVAFAAASGIVFYALFVYAVHIPFDEGLLFTLVTN